MKSKTKVAQSGNTPAPSTPIQIVVSEFEALAHAEAGNAPDHGIGDFVLLKLIAQGARADEAGQLAAQIEEAALKVRRRIEEATRYELRVVKEPMGDETPSTEEPGAGMLISEELSEEPPTP